MKKTLKRYTSLKNYIAFLRRQPKHMQHVSAFVFAGALTAAIASIILYVDYGFWHEKYSSTLGVIDTSTTSPEAQVPESPVEMLTRFFGDAKEQLRNVDTVGTDFLEGKETYSKDVK